LLKYRCFYKLSRGILNIRQTLLGADEGCSSSDFDQVDFTQLRPYLPAGLQAALALVGLLLVLGGVDLLLQRWLKRLAS
jgi:hypothetical protein